MGVANGSGFALVGVSNHGCSGTAAKAVCVAPIKLTKTKNFFILKTFF
jgi:hypothetical protein